MRGQGGFFDVDDRLKELSAKGDDLERLNAIVDFEVFRPGLARAVPRSDGSKGGRPAFDHVLMFKVLILQAAHGLSDERPSTGHQPGEAWHVLGAPLTGRIRRSTATCGAGVYHRGLGHRRRAARRSSGNVMPLGRNSRRRIPPLSRAARKTADSATAGSPCACSQANPSPSCPASCRASTNFGAAPTRRMAGDTLGYDGGSHAALSRLTRLAFVRTISSDQGA